MRYKSGHHHHHHHHHHERLFAKPGVGQNWHWYVREPDLVTAAFPGESEASFQRNMNMEIYYRKKNKLINKKKARTE